MIRLKYVDPYCRKWRFINVADGMRVCYYLLSLFTISLIKYCEYNIKYSIQYHLFQQYKATGPVYRPNCTYVRVMNIYNMNM